MSVQRAKEESGAALILALAFMTIILGLTFGMVGFAQTGAKAVRAYKIERLKRYTVDGAINAQIQNIRKDYLKGISPDLSPGPTDCGLQYEVYGGDPRFVVGNAYLKVTCFATPLDNLSPPTTNSGRLDTDGGQGPRDVTIVVSCNNGPGGSPKVPNMVSCGTGISGVELARARVRFEIDPTITPTTQRAVIPKILSWQVRV